MTHFLLKDIIGKNHEEIFIVDVGAMPEGAPRYDILMKNYRTRLVGFEPNEEQLEKLHQLDDSSAEYLPYFLGEGKDHQFNVTRYPGCSSLYQPDPQLIDLFTSIGACAGGNFEVMEVGQVSTNRLDDIYQHPAAHMIKLDVQGAELDILQGAEKTLQKTLVLESEVEFVPLYREQPLFGDIQCFLREKGFLLHKFIDMSGRCFRPISTSNNPYVPMSQLLYADAIFVRDFTRLDRLSDTDLLFMAIIMNDIYRSYDFVSFLLAEYDKRQGTEFRKAFLDKLQSIPKLQLLYLNKKERP